MNTANRPFGSSQFILSDIHITELQNARTENQDAAGKNAIAVLFIHEQVVHIDVPKINDVLEQLAVYTHHKLLNPPRLIDLCVCKSKVSVNHTHSI